LRPTFVPSGILIHPAVWTQQTWAENLWGGSAPFLLRGTGSPSNMKSPGLHPYQVASWCIQPFGHKRNGPKIGEETPPPFGGGRLDPHLTHSRQGWCLPPCQVPASSIQPFGHNKHGPKIWRGAPPTIGAGRAESPSNTKSPGPRPSSIPSDILIHAAIWPQLIWAENWWGLCPFGGGGAGSPCNSVARAEAYLHANFHLDTSNRLATVHERYGQADRTGQTYRQRSASIGRTVLQTVAQKFWMWCESAKNDHAVALVVLFS